MDKEDVIEQYKEIAKTYRTYEDCYKLITEKNNIDILMFCLDYDGIWKRLELEWTLNFFLKNEEYEKCEVLKNFMDEHYIGDEDKQNELNEKLRNYLNQNKDDEG